MQAADLLVRVHAALLTAPQPSGRQHPPTVPDADLADPDLDAFLRATTAEPAQPLHGDYYRGNVLVADDVITALLDWDEAFVGPVAAEVAAAAWEWGNCLTSGNLDGAYRFAAAYASAGGVPVDRMTIRQYARERLRREIMNARARWNQLDTDDHQYHLRQMTAFHDLRPRRL